MATRELDHCTSCECEVSCSLCRLVSRTPAPVVSVQLVALCGDDSVSKIDRVPVSVTSADELQMRGKLWRFVDAVANGHVL